MCCRAHECISMQNSPISLIIVEELENYGKDDGEKFPTIQWNLQIEENYITILYNSDGTLLHPQQFLTFMLEVDF